MRYVSLFSGVEAATLAWEPMGWEPVVFCEVDEFPSAVLAERWPDVPNLGDICKVDWNDFKEKYGAVDIVVGGSPCQSFSLAGGRESLQGESRLMYEYVRAVRDLQPRWLLWENVPGALSTRDDAFGCLLEALQDSGYHDLAWRTFDAQFARVPVRDDNGRIARWIGPVAQRRRRVFLVGHLGTGGRSAAVLFERESLRGDNPSSKQKREALARAAGRGAACEGFKYHQGAKAGGIGNQQEQSPTLTADYHNPAVLTATAIRTANSHSNGMGITEECAHTVACTQPEAVCLQTDHLSQNGKITSVELSKTIDTQTPPAVCFAQNNRNEVRLQNGDGEITGPVCASVGFKGQGVPYVMATGQANAEVTENMTPTLNCAHEQPIVVDRAAFNQGKNAAYPPHREVGCDERAGCEGAARCGVQASNGEQLIGALCARDYKGVGTQFVNEGKVICQRMSSK